MRKRRHARRRRRRDQRPEMAPKALASPAREEDDFDDPDDYPIWERDHVMEDYVAIMFARETGAPLPEPRHPLSWAFTHRPEAHERVIPCEDSLIWRACQAAYVDVENRWQSRCEVLRKRKSSGRWPELSDSLDDACD
jgi:hypothetical protein